MATVTSFSANIFVKNLTDRPSSFSRTLPLSQSWSSGLGFRGSFSINLDKKIKPVPALNLTFDPEVSNGSKNAEEELERQRTLPSKTIHVIFRLKKKCKFGEQFYVVGNNPMLGLWDPTNAVPLTWSDGHLWTAEMDVPIGLAIQFKFILKSREGEVIWQPGPDRIFKAWEDTNTTVISDDWENADLEEREITDEMSEQEFNRDMVLVFQNGDATIQDYILEDWKNANPKKLTEQDQMSEEELNRDTSPVLDNNEAVILDEILEENPSFVTNNEFIKADTSLSAKETQSMFVYKGGRVRVSGLASQEDITATIEVVPEEVGGSAKDDVFVEANTTN